MTDPTPENLHDLNAYKATAAEQDEETRRLADVLNVAPRDVLERMGEVDPLEETRDLGPIARMFTAERARKFLKATHEQEDIPRPDIELEAWADNAARQLVVRMTQSFLKHEKDLGERTVNVPATWWSHLLHSLFTHRFLKWGFVWWWPKRLKPRYRTLHGRVYERRNCPHLHVPDAMPHLNFLATDSPGDVPPPPAPETKTVPPTSMIGPQTVLVYIVDNRRARVIQEMGGMGWICSWMTDGRDTFLVPRDRIGLDWRPLLESEATWRERVLQLQRQMAWIHRELATRFTGMGEEASAERDTFLAELTAGGGAREYRGKLSRRPVTLWHDDLALYRRELRRTIAFECCKATCDLCLADTPATVTPGTGWMHPSPEDDGPAFVACEADIIRKRYALIFRQDPPLQPEPGQPTPTEPTP